MSLTLTVNLTPGAGVKIYSASVDGAPVPFDLGTHVGTLPVNPGGHTVVWHFVGQGDSTISLVGVLSDGRKAFNIPSSKALPNGLGAGVDPFTV
jgi:hypothetical protein